MWNTKCDPAQPQVNSYTWTYSYFLLWHVRTQNVEVFFCSVCNHFIMQNTNTGSISSHPSSRVFCPPHAPITTSLHRLSTMNQCMVMVRDLGHWQPCLSRETVKRTEAWVGLLMEGYRVGRGEELSMVLAVVEAVMHMGHCDLRLFLSLDLSALLSTASAPSLAFC